MQLGKLIDSRLFIAKINIADTCFNENVSVVLYTSDKITSCMVKLTQDPYCILQLDKIKSFIV